MRPHYRRLVFGAPVIGETEIASVTDCLRSKWIGLGPKVEQFEHEFACYKAADYAAAVSSGTAAIHLALVTFGIGAGDEVIAPAMTWCSTIHSIVHASATPVFVDCEPDTFNINPNAIEEKITARTKAILVVHMCGRCCDMEPVLAIAQKHGLRVIEDCAHALESTYRGQPSGLMGDAGCFSFYATKNITTGEGGMLIMREQKPFQRAKVLSSQGMTADAWTRFACSASGYEFVEAGFKDNMTDLAAALGLPQLLEIDQRWKQRERIWRLYDQHLQDLPLVLPKTPEPGSRHAYHLYTPLLQVEKIRVNRQAIIAALDAENIGVGIHYVPVHQQPYYRRKFGFADSDYPNAAFVGERTISLPLQPDMSEGDVADVTAALRRIFRYYAA